MKAKKHGTVKIDAELLAEFEGCIEVSKYGHNSIVVNDDMRYLLENVYAKTACNRKAFAIKFKAKFGVGTLSTLTRLCEREGIKVESGRKAR